jgi:hypothetical protein
MNRLERCRIDIFSCHSLTMVIIGASSAPWGVLAETLSASFVGSQQPSWCAPQIQTPTGAQVRHHTTVSCVDFWTFGDAFVLHPLPSHYVWRNRERSRTCDACLLARAALRFCVFESEDGRHVKDSAGIMNSTCEAAKRERSTAEDPQTIATLRAVRRSGPFTPYTGWFSEPGRLGTELDTSKSQSRVSL